MGGEEDCEAASEAQDAGFRCCYKGEGGLVYCETCHRGLATRKHTIINGSHGVQTRTRSHDYNAPARLLALHVVHGERRGVDNTVQVDVQRRAGGFLQLACCVGLEREVVGTGSDAGVGKDKVDAAMGGDGGFEQSGERRPLADVGRDKGEGAGRRWGVDVCADYLCAQRGEELDGCEANS